MNRRFLIIVGIVFLLIVGGGLTSFIAAEGASGLIPGVLEVTRDSEASVNEFAPGQGVQLALLIGFILFNLVGASLTGALIFWFLNREVVDAYQMEEANHETFRDAFRRPTASEGELTAEN